MTLLITVFSAVISTVCWYRKLPDNTMLISVLCWMYWGASLMWFADAIFEYAELGAAYFSPSPATMLNDAFLGLSAVALGLVIWVMILLIKDPRGEIKRILFHKNNKD